jgi:CSLREA domain-containing protein
VVPFVRRFSWLALVALLLLGLPTAPASAQTTYTVNTNADTDDGCNAAGCSLREAIKAANASAGADVIQFSVSGPIRPTTELPELTGGNITINGGSGRVTLDGGSTEIANGITISSANNEVRGLVIINFNTILGSGFAAGGNGIHLTGSATTGNKIYNNYIGVAADGNTAARNQNFGVLIDNGASNNDIGGSTAGLGNVISANRVSNIYIGVVSDSSVDPVENNRIAGNNIGTNAAGTAQPSGVNLNESQGGITIYEYARNNVIGPNNVIAGHRTGSSTTKAGILFDGPGSNDPDIPNGTVIKGNYIGMSRAGDAIPNDIGIRMAITGKYGPQNTTIGDPNDLAAGRNYIGGNPYGGIVFPNNSPPNGNATIAGNYIGLFSDSKLVPNGTTSTPNDGIFVGSTSGSTVVTIGPGNVISANRGNGIRVRANNTVIKGNYINTNIAGTSSTNSNETTVGLANFFAGILIERGTGTLVGGSSGADRNIIAYGGSQGEYTGLLIQPGSSDTTGNHTVRGNSFGINAAATNRLNTNPPTPNFSRGIEINGSSSNLVEGNILGGSLYGVLIWQDATPTAPNGNTIRDNIFGTNFAGATDSATAANLRLTRQGIRVREGSNNTLSDNLIVNNGESGTDAIPAAGVLLQTGASGNSLTNNRITNTAAGPGVNVKGVQRITISRTTTQNNNGPGIALNEGGNASLAAPTLSSMSGTTLTGTAPAACSSGGCVLEVFTSANRDDGEGPIYLTQQTGVSGNFSVNVAGCSRYLTATVRDADGDTSPFSSPMLDSQSAGGSCQAPNFTLGAASPNARSAEAGTSVTYVHRLTNNDAIARTFTIELNSSQGWANAPATVNVGANTFADVTITVAIPAGASVGSVDTTTIRATVSGYQSATQTDTTTVQAVALDPANPVISGAQSKTINPSPTPTFVGFTHTVTNNGEQAGTFAVTAAFVGTATGWTALSVTPATLNLAAGASQQIELRVTPPANAPPQTIQIRITVRETSNNNQAQVTDSVTVATVTSFSFTEVAPADVTTGPGTTRVFTHTLTNTGNSSDSYNINVAPQSPLTASVSPSNPINLNAGQSATVRVTVTIPSTTPGGNPTPLAYNVSVSAQRTAGGASDTNTNTVRVSGEGRLTISPDSAKNALPGASATFTNTVTNNGNVATAVTFPNPTAPSGYSATVIGNTCGASLAINASCTFTVRVNVPANAQVSSQNIGVSATATAGNRTATATNVVNVLLVPGFTLTAVNPTSRTVGPLSTAVFTHTLTNTGNGRDSFTISVTPQSPLTASFTPSNPIELNAGQSISVRVTVNIGNSVPQAIYNVNVSANRTAGGTPKTNVNQVTVAPGAALALTTGPAQNTPGLTAAVLTFNNTLQNRGNLAAPVAVTLLAAPFNAVISSNTCTGSLAVDATCNFSVQMTVPADANAGTYTTTIRASADNTDPVQDSVVSGSNVVTVQKAGALLFTPDRDGLVLPTRTVTYTHLLTNTGNASDNFTLSFARSDNTWPATLQPQNLNNVPRGATRAVTVTVTVPEGKLEGETMVLTVTAVSANTPSVSAQVIDTTVTEGFDAAVISPGITTNADVEEGPVTRAFTHTLTNTGNTTIAYDIVLSNSRAEWPAPVLTSANPTPVLAPGETTTVTLEVTAPADATNGISNTTTVAILASGETAPVLASAQNVIRVGPRFAVLLDPPINVGEVIPNGSTFFTHTLTNIGLDPDSYRIVASDPQGWIAEAVPSEAELAPGESITVTVRIDVPGGQLAGVPGVSLVEVRSDSAGEVLAVGREEVTVAQVANLRFDAADETIIYGDDSAATFELPFYTLNNLGNGIDTADLTIDDDLGWTVAISPTARTINPNDKFSFIRVVVTIPEGARRDADNIVQITARSQVDSRVTAEARIAFRIDEIILTQPDERLYLPITRR